MACVCPFPLVTPDPIDSDEGILIPFCCAIPCTGTMSSDGEIALYDRIVLGTSTIGMITGLFIVLTWGIFRVKQKQQVTFWLSFCALNLTFSIWLGAIATQGNSSDLWCKSSNEATKQSDGGICVYQGICIVFFALALCCWWFVSCFDLFSKLVLEKRNVVHYLRYYHIFCWSVPSICTIGLLSAEQFGYFAPRVWCFLVEGELLAEWLGFNAIMTTLWIIGTILMIAVVVVLARRIEQVEGSSSSPRKYLRNILLYKQPLAFVFSFSVVWLIFVSLSILIVVNEDSYIESATSWANCLLFNAAAGIIDPARNESADTSILVGEPADITKAGCGVVQPGRIGRELLTLAILTLSASSIIVFLVFGLHSQNYKLWRDLFCPRRNESSYSYEESNKFATQTSTMESIPPSYSMAKRPPLSYRAERAVQSFRGARNYATDLYSRGLGLVGVDEQAVSGTQRDINPRNILSEQKRAPKRQPTAVLDEMSYEEWESQFMTDALWGIK